MQLATPRKEKVPAGQGLIEELGVGQLYPAGQCLHDVAPCDRYLKYYVIQSFNFENVINCKSVKVQPSICFLFCFMILFYSEGLS